MSIWAGLIVEDTEDGHKGDHTKDHSYTDVCTQAVALTYLHLVRMSLKLQNCIIYLYIFPYKENQKDKNTS